MKREIRPGEYEGILEKLKSAAPPEDLFNEVSKAYSNSEVLVLLEQEEWKEVTELLKRGIYPIGGMREGEVLEKVNYDFYEQVLYKNVGDVKIDFPISFYDRPFAWYHVESRYRFSFDYKSVTNKEQSRRNWLLKLEKSDAIGITTPLTREQYTWLSDCCTPISIEYLEKMVEEAKDMPEITPEMVYEYVKQCYDTVYKDSPILPSPAPVPTPKGKKRLSWFERLF